MCSYPVHSPASEVLSDPDEVISHYVAGYLVIEHPPKNVHLPAPRSLFNCSTRISNGL